MSIAAGVVSVAGKVAAVTFFEMATESGPLHSELFPELRFLRRVFRLAPQ